MESGVGDLGLVLARLLDLFNLLGTRNGSRTCLVQFWDAPVLSLDVTLWGDRSRRESKACQRADQSGV